jgi:uncharacterized iron-regulated membrane protein
MDTIGYDIAAKVAKQAAGAMTGDIVSAVTGVLTLIAVVVGLFFLIALFSRKRRRRKRRGRGRKR